MDLKDQTSYKLKSKIKTEKLNKKKTHVLCPLYIWSQIIVLLSFFLTCSCPSMTGCWFVLFFVLEVDDGVVTEGAAAVNDCVDDHDLDDSDDDDSGGGIHY